MAFLLSEGAVPGGGEGRCLPAIAGPKTFSAKLELATLPFDLISKLLGTLHDTAQA